MVENLEVNLGASGVIFRQLLSGINQKFQFKNVNL